MKDARIRWNYNYRCLANLASLGHGLESETLHKDIHRVPCSSVLLFQDKRLKIKTFDWEEVNIDYSPDFCTPENVLLSFNKACKSLVENNNNISMSGGYDSRLILSFFLREKLKPSLLVMGNPDSTDALISRKIAHHYKLKIEVIPLDLKDYFDSAMKIVYLTGGTKTFEHWHTFIYANKASLDKSTPLFIGSNGEFVRSYYTNVIPFIYLSNFSSRLSVPLFWALKLKMFLKRHRKCFRDNEMNMLSTDFSKELDNIRTIFLATRLSSLCNYELISGCDKFYLEQRVRTLISNGLRLLSDSYKCKTPFLDYDFISCAFKLPLKFKRNSSWHIYAMKENYNSLLQFEFEHDCKKITPYANYPEMFNTKEIKDFLKDNSYVVSDIIDPKLIDTVLLEHSITKSRTTTISFLLTQINWKLCLNREGVV
ncbi:hypothetical protein ACSYAD_20360 [Acaryochloris marina NIES-2412]|uniref:hypothetical protein n=1 Tax=Acaryochloris marina TaxID=155978 RepID=UPI004057CD5B